MRSVKLFPAIIALLASTTAFADDVKVGVGISGWTGFAPLTLAKEAGMDGSIAFTGSSGQGNCRD